MVSSMRSRGLIGAERVQPALLQAATMYRVCHQLNWWTASETAVLVRVRGMRSWIGV
jgi:hypothetical protein